VFRSGWIRWARTRFDDLDHSTERAARGHKTFVSVAKCDHVAEIFVDDGLQSTRGRAPEADASRSHALSGPTGDTKKISITATARVSVHSLASILIHYSTN
jgi:hypothetical protein